MLEIKKKGSFSVKSVYWEAGNLTMSNIMANSSSERGFDPLWKSLWIANIPGKVAICIWRGCYI